MAQHILLLSGWYYPDSVGGTEEYVHLLGKELQILGCDVRIAAPSNSEREHNYVNDGLTIYRYPVPLKPSRLEVGGSAVPKHFDVFKELVDKTKPDLVHMHSYTRGCGFFHAQYVKKLGIPLVLTIHVPDLICIRGTMMRWGTIPCNGKTQVYRCTACWIQKYDIYRFLTWLMMKKIFINRKEQIKRLFTLADSIVVVSKWLYDALRLNGISDYKLTLCRHGLPFGRLTRTKNNFEAKPPNPLRIGYIGRFNPVKGVHVIIKAVKMLPSNFSIELKLYGRVNNEEERTYFRKLKRIANEDSRITFCGELTDKNRQEVFNTLNFIAVPSLWFEAGPFVVLEAFMAGIPVMGSNLPGISELVTNGINGILVEAGNVKAWCNTLKRLSSYPSLTRDLIQGLPSVRNNKEVAEEMIGIYNKILETGHFRFNS